MKKALLLLLLPIYTYAYNPTILSMETEYPLEVKAENTPQNPQKLFQNKQFHWEYVFGLLVFGIVYLIARQQQFRPVDVEKIQRKRLMLSKKRALESIEKLIQENPLKEEFYTRITNIVRQYIEESYAIRASTETTEEFLNDLIAHPVFDKATQTTLTALLQNADAIKFSSHTPTEQECAQAHKTAKSFIQIH